MAHEKWIWTRWIIAQTKTLPGLFWKLLLLGGALRERSSASGISTVFVPKFLLALITHRLGCVQKQKLEFSLKMTKNSIKKLVLLLSPWCRLKLSGQEEFYNLRSVPNRDVFKHKIEFQHLRGKNKEWERMKKSEMCHIRDCSQVLLQYRELRPYCSISLWATYLARWNWGTFSSFIKINSPPRD